MSKHLHRPHAYQIVDDGGVLNTITRVLPVASASNNPTGMNVSLPNIFNLINMMPRVCLALPSRLTLMMRCFGQYGRMLSLSKLLTADTRLGAHVMAHHAPVKPAFSMRHTQTVWTKREAESFTLFRLLKIC